MGAGGMGAVYEAEETASGRRVALKLIMPEFAGTAEAVERFRQEGRIASMVAHPRCVFVLGVDEEAGQPYIVMELMPGSTLKDLVDQQGPLPPEQAIAKILDVIEGLQEAHRLEVIHRDVKPSNCFLEPDGRVKVGDFGLAKSLVKDAHLTKTGAFVGTPHFASPEQIRGEPIDRQTDVYSVAATLYFLLTGKPPFWGTDSAATLARIVSDPAPSLRSVRPELSPALDRVVLRGLERDRKRRWPDLDAFRQALIALVPNRLSLPGLGRRLAAYLLDALALFVVYRLILLVLAQGMDSTRSVEHELSVLALARGLGLVFFVAYFTVLEHLWGCSLGKGILRLRVCTAAGVDPPGWGASLLRSLVVYGVLHLGLQLSLLVLWLNAADIRLAWLDVVVTWSWTAAGSLCLLSTMRVRNGYQGLHEVLSGTRVAELPRPRQREALLSSGGWLLSFLRNRRLDQGLAQMSSLPGHIGGFAIRGALKWTEHEKVLLGEDASLGRRVFIWLRPQSAAPLDSARRDIGRRTRLRWLGCGRQGDLQWDAILAPSGCPLPEFIRSEGTLEWSEARPLLEDLAGELAAACGDGTLPPALSVAQVWIQPQGRAQLADTALTLTSSENGVPPANPQERALGLLKQVAALALEGEPRPQDSQAPIRASLPQRGRTIVDRLVGPSRAYHGPEEFLADLSAASSSDEG
jgi:uncharacterized RDD family membrane protein YckC